MLIENDAILQKFKDEEAAIDAVVGVLRKRVSEPVDNGCMGYGIKASGMAIVFGWTKPGNKSYFDLDKVTLLDADDGLIPCIVEKYSAEFGITEDLVVRLLQFGKQVIQKAYPDALGVFHPMAHIYTSGDVRLLMCLDKMDKPVIH